MDNWLAAKAREYEETAYGARLAARRIERELVELKGCLEPIKDLHNIKTWESTSASRSRHLLNGHRSFYLNSIVGKLKHLVEELNIYSYVLEQNAENFRRLSVIEAAS